VLKKKSAQRPHFKSNNREFKSMFSIHPRESMACRKSGYLGLHTKTLASGGYPKWAFQLANVDRDFK
jgi:hypothetical protein